MIGRGLGLLRGASSGWCVRCSPHSCLSVVRGPSHWRRESRGPPFSRLSLPGEHLTHQPLRSVSNSCCCSASCSSCFFCSASTARSSAVPAMLPADRVALVSSLAARQTDDALSWTSLVMADWLGGTSSGPTARSSRDTYAACHHLSEQQKRGWPHGLRCNPAAAPPPLLSFAFLPIRPVLGNPCLFPNLPFSGVRSPVPKLVIKPRRRACPRASAPC